MTIDDAVRAMKIDDSVRVIKIADEFRGIKLYDELYMVEFHDTAIRTTVTNNPQVVIEWISEIERIHGHLRRKKLIVGLIYQPKPVAVLQLCVDDRCLIYQLNRTSKISETLYLFITSPVHVFVGAGIVSCLEKLQEGFGIDLNNLNGDCLDVNDIDEVDFGILAKKFFGRDDLMNAGLQQFAKVFLDIEMGTPGEWTTMIYWDYRRLTESQVGNACVEAFVSFKLGKALKADCFMDCYVTTQFNLGNLQVETEEELSGDAEEKTGLENGLIRDGPEMIGPLKDELVREGAALERSAGLETTGPIKEELTSGLDNLK